MSTSSALPIDPGPAGTRVDARACRGVARDYESWGDFRADLDRDRDRGADVVLVAALSGLCSLDGDEIRRARSYDGGVAWHAHHEACSDRSGEALFGWTYTRTSGEGDVVADSIYTPAGWTRAHVIYELEELDKRVAKTRREDLLLQARCEGWSAERRADVLTHHDAHYASTPVFELLDNDD